MSTYTNRLTSSDLDAYRSDGTVYTDSITFTGTVAGSGSQVKTSTGIAVTDLDFYQILFDNSTHHSGKWRVMTLEGSTFVFASSTSTEEIASLTPKISSGVLYIVGEVFNSSSSSETLQDTTINFRLVAYDSTLL